jgi:hypothetical protein
VGGNDEILSDLTLGPEPDARAGLPAIEFEDEPMPAARPREAPARPPLPAPARAAPAAAAVTTRPPARAHDPQGTLVSKREEAAELRRRIATPGPPEDVEMDLEEIEEFETNSKQGVAPAGPPAADGPAAAGVVEVPIDIDIAPGATRVSLSLKLVLNLKRR